MEVFIPKILYQWPSHSGNDATFDPHAQQCDCENDVLILFLKRPLLSPSIPEVAAIEELVISGCTVPGSCAVQLLLAHWLPPLALATVCVHTCAL